MEANEISLDLEYEKRDENGKLEYEGISFVEDEFPAFLIMFFNDILLFQ